MVWESSETPPWCGRAVRHPHGVGEQLHPHGVGEQLDTPMVWGSREGLMDLHIMKAERAKGVTKPHLPLPPAHAHLKDHHTCDFAVLCQLVAHLVLQLLVHLAGPDLQAWASVFVRGGGGGCDL
eukprot:41204-Chlamydomonas_euryale.AAC.1